MLGGTLSRRDASASAFARLLASSCAAAASRKFRVLWSLVNASVIMLAWNAATGPDWQAATAYALGQVVAPAANNGHLYQATTAGASGSSRPAFPTNGTTVTDGTVTWADLGTASAVQVSKAAAPGSAGVAGTGAAATVTSNDICHVLTLTTSGTGGQAGMTMG